MKSLKLNLEVEGTLCSGLGEGARFTQLAWAAREFRDKLGFAPYPGTLNLMLSGADWTAARSRLQQAAGIAIVPPSGFCAAKCFPVTVNDRIEGAVVLPEVGNYPADKCEILAPVGLRQELDLRDGDAVRLRVEIA
ncbi:MAG: CTP-dependent riboflavin kinase [Ramlibacter sp.]|nr:CTP-dependent riboflavin kinase [Ramlibacter sp.]